MTKTRLREDSRKKLEQTRRDYARLIKAMKRAEKKIQPVLVAFRDQVLYLNIISTPRPFLR
jgi:hypothetical protein